VIAWERPVFYRERASDAYPSWVYSTAIFVTEAPLVLLAAWLFVTPFYFLLGFSSSASLYFKFLFAQYLFCLFFVSVGHFFISALPNLVVSTQLAGLFYFMTFLFGGLFIHIRDIPVGWQWFYYLNCIPKATTAMLIPQLECTLPNPYEVTSGCPTIEIPGAFGSTLMTIHAYGNNVLDAGYDSYWRYIGWLVLNVVVARILVSWALAKINHLKK